MFQAVIDHLWQSTLFAFGIALLCMVLRNDGARIRYWLWWAASLKFLVPFSLLTALGARFAGEAVVPYIFEAWTEVASNVAQPLVVPTAADVQRLLFGAWLVGSIAVLARWLTGTLRLRSLLLEAEPLAAPVRCGRRWIGIFRTRERIEPGVAGIFRPEIILPQGIETHLRPEQLEVVIAHELCHVRRRDNLTAVVQRLVETAFWYFPPVWWIGGRLVDERERACDEEVVALGHDRETYAESVLDVCEHFATLPVAAVAGVSGGVLARRVTHIMRSATMNRLGFLKKTLLGTAAAGVIAVPILVGLTLQRPAAAQDVPPNAPIVKVAPIYPPRAAARGLSRRVTVEFTLTTTGSTRDIEVVESSPATLFDRATIDAVAKWKYRPALENGSAVEVPGVRATIVYEPGQAGAGPAPGPGPADEPNGVDLTVKTNPQ